ncbi:hypothetical protein KJ671_00465 [Patescibacteria group bacterium]|nr:hypothetical protein [Patescibacteria group bacterium]
MARKIELTNKDRLCILGMLFALRGQEGLLISEIQKKLQVNSKQIEYALKFLRSEFYIFIKTTPIKNNLILVRYVLSWRGKRFLKTFDSLLEKGPTE